MNKENWLAGRAVTLLINPAARAVPAGYRGGPIVRYLEARGISVAVSVPDSREAAVAAARQSAARGDAALFALGGDGTMRDAAEGLASSGTALAALRGGTVNIWCREAGIPPRIGPALEAHLHGQRLPIDLGRAGGRRFLLMASGGWDGAVAKGVSPWLKERIGDYAYILRGVKMLRGLRSHPMRFRRGITTEDRDVAMFVLGNTRLYGGRVRFTPRATVNDGVLDLVTLGPRSLWETARIATRVLQDRLVPGEAVSFEKVAAMALVSPGVAIQADGDYIGDSPMEFCVEPGALLVSVPAGGLAPIFGTTDQREHGA